MFEFSAKFMGIAVDSETITLQVKVSPSGDTTLKQHWHCVDVDTTLFQRYVPAGLCVSFI